MMGLFQQLLSSDFMPHGFCYQWNPQIVWLHVISDALIALSYYCIPVILVYFVLKHRLPLSNRVFLLLFGGFILACGTTHLLEIWNVWHGSYLLAGIVKAITAVVSVATAAVLIPLAPKVISLPSRLQLDELNRELDRQLAERKQSEEALREKKRLLSESQRIAHVGSWSFDLNDPSGRIVWSEELYRIYGVSPETFIPTVESLLGLVVPEDRATMQKWIAACAGGEQPGDFEFRVTLPDGRIRCFSGQGELQLDASHRPVRMVGCAQDITERKQAEEALRQSDARRKFALETAKLGAWEIDLSTLQATRSLLHDQIFGYASLLPEWSFDIFLSHVHADDRERVREDFQRCLSTGKRWDFECRTVWPNGQIRWLWACGDHLRDSSGEATRISGIVQDITERKRVADALHESEECFHAMLNGIPQLAWMANPEGDIFWYNQRWYDYTGTTLSEMEGWGWKSVHDSETLPRVLERWQGSIAAGTPFEMEFPLRAADGHFGMFLTRVMPLHDADGKVARWFGTNTDISERKKTEEQAATHAREIALRADELERSREAQKAQTAMFQLVLDNMGEGLVAADREGHFLIWNNSARKLLGRGPEELSTEKWSTHYGCFGEDGITPVPTGDLPLVRAMRGESVQTQLVIRHPGNESGCILEFVGQPMTDDRGSLRGGVVVFRDITERKYAEKELADQSEELAQQAEALTHSRQALEKQTLTLQSVLNSMAEGLSAADENGKLIIWNKAAERILGPGAADLPTQNRPEHFGAFLPDTVTLLPHEQSPMTRALRGESMTGELFVRNAAVPDGIWIEASGEPMRDEAGVVRGGVVAFRDITQRKKDEHEIRKLNDELEIRVMERTAQMEVANKELEAFSYSVSHDLRAPLRHIGGFSKLLVEEFAAALPPGAQLYLDRIQAGTRKMGLLVDELLGLARVGRHALRLQPTQLGSVVAEVIAILEHETTSRQVEWRVADLSSADCDPVLVAQIFQNLLANALKFTRPCDRAVIEVGQHEEHGQTVFTVRDNGTGFDMKYVNKLFGVFQRLHREEEFEGTGIGLATVQRIVHKHGGEVWAEGEPNKGATFSFTLAPGKRAELKSNGVTAGGQS